MIEKVTWALSGVIILSLLVSGEREHENPIKKIQYNVIKHEPKNYTSRKPLHDQSSARPSVKDFRTTAVIEPAVEKRPIYVQNVCNTTDIAEAAAAAIKLLTKLAPFIDSSTRPALSTGNNSIIDISQAYKKTFTESTFVAPADPVSISLAYQMYQNSMNNKVIEENISYGFRKLPSEMPIHRKPHSPIIPMIPEEDLYSIKQPVLELKPAADFPSVDSLSAEALEDLMDTSIQDELNDVNSAIRPCLSDFGYSPVKNDYPTFLDIPSLPELPSITAIPERTSSVVSITTESSKAINSSEESIPLSLVPRMASPASHSASFRVTRDLTNLYNPGEIIYKDLSLCSDDKKSSGSEASD